MEINRTEGLIFDGPMENNIYNKSDSSDDIVLDDTVPACDNITAHDHATTRQVRITNV